MPILSAQDIKAQLIKEAESKVMSKEIPDEIMSKADKHLEIGANVRRMTQTTGWKILEYWMIKQIDLWNLLNATGEEGERLKTEGRVYGKILSQIEYWMRLAERIESLRNKEKSKEE
jgi:hypothetical protein